MFRMTIGLICAATIFATGMGQSSAAEPEVRIVEINPAREFIRGTVSGLTPGENEKLKIALMMKTDKWYVHPFQADYTTTIRADGQWRIRHVPRGHEEEVAALLLDVHATLPMTAVDVGELGAKAFVRVPYRIGKATPGGIPEKQPGSPLGRPAVRISEINVAEGFVRGVVSGLPEGATDTHTVALYVFTDYWYVHPYQDNYRAKIAKDGSWRISHVRRGGEKLIGALLVRKDARLPAKTGTFEGISALATVWVPYKPGVIKAAGTSAPKPSPAETTLRFSGEQWVVKTGVRGPGPNHFAKSCVHLDEDSSLHLRIRKENGIWVCGEVFSTQHFGYGEYRWQYTALDLQRLDPRTILGLFVYQNDTNEIDFELARWGDADAADGQFVVQPARKGETMHRFQTGEHRGLTVSFVWRPGAVDFRCWRGVGPEAEIGKPIAEWTYEGKAVPEPDRQKVHMNFYLAAGQPPANRKSAEIVIRSFRFTPTAKGETHAGSAPRIQVWVEKGSEVRGSVTGILPEHAGNYRVKVYAYTDRWYVQPFLGSAHRLERDLTFSTWTRMWRRLRADLVEVKTDTVVATDTFNKGDPVPAGGVIAP